MFGSAQLRRVAAPARAAQVLDAVDAERDRGIELVRRHRPAVLVRVGDDAASASGREAARRS